MAEHVSGNNALFPAINSPQRQSNATGSGRNKVALAKGRSLMDWIRLGNSGVDLTGVEGKLMKVTEEELKKHNTREDCWIAIRGKVYNITKYCEFHPGGISEIMKGAGIDSTDLFNQVHRWVNFESMLQKCLVGRLVSNHVFVKPSFGSSLTVPQGLPTTNLRTVNKPQVDNKNLLPFSRPLAVPEKPRFDYYQNGEAVKLMIYTRTPGVGEQNLVLERLHNSDVAQSEGPEVKVTVYLPTGKFYRVHFIPFRPLLSACSVKAVSSIGKIEIDMPKANPGESWTRIGRYLPDHNTLEEESSTQYIDCVISQVSRITRDTKLLNVSLPEGCHMVVPVGCHIITQASVNGMEITRRYTPICDISAETIQHSSSELQLLIKIYPDGVMTSVVDQYKEGDTMRISHWQGLFRISNLDKFSKIVLLAAGTGITPMFKIMRHCLASQKRVSMLFFNKKECDIYFREKLNQLSSTCDKFSVTHILSDEPGWSGKSGRLTQDMIEEIIADTDNSQLFIAACGPSGFLELVCRYIKYLNLAENQLMLFS